MTPPPTAAGFRLGGFEVFTAASREDARGVLARLVVEGVAGEPYALVVVDEELLPEPYAAVEREMRTRELPVLLPCPSLTAALEAKAGEVEEYMRRLVKETVGYEIKPV